MSRMCESRNITLFWYWKLEKMFCEVAHRVLVTKSCMNNIKNAHKWRSGKVLEEKAASECLIQINDQRYV